MKSSVHRIKKYKSKVDGSISQLHLSRYGKTQKELFKLAAAKQVEIERQVKAYMAMHGISTMYTNYYILFAKNMVNPNPTECNIEFNKWCGRNLSWYHLRNIGRMIFNRRLNLYEVDPDPVCVMYLPFSEGAGTTTFDKSGNGRNGTLNMPTWQEGVLGNGLYFDGVDDYVEVSNALLPPTEFQDTFTLVVWIQPDSAGEGAGRIFDKSDGSSAQNGFRLFVDPGGIRLGLGINAGPNIFGDVNELAYDGNWFFVVSTVTAAGLITHHVNGVQTGTPAISNPTAGITSTSSLRIGNRAGATDATFDGRIDEPRIFKRILTESEIKNMYNAERPFHHDLLE